MSTLLGSRLELKIPPPVVALCLAFLMWGALHLVQALVVPFGFRVVTGLALGLIGQGITISGMVAFRRARTTINPFNPGAASSLVSGGIYRFTRNPMSWASFSPSWAGLHSWTTRWRWP